MRPLPGPVQVIRHEAGGKPRDGEGHDDQGHFEAVESWLLVASKPKFATVTKKGCEDEGAASANFTCQTMQDACKLKERWGLEPLRCRSQSAPLRAALCRSGRCGYSTGTTPPPPPGGISPA